MSSAGRTRLRPRRTRSPGRVRKERFFEIKTTRAAGIGPEFNQPFYFTGNIEKYGSGFIWIRKGLEDNPEVKLEISESGHGVLLSFLKTAPPPESQPVTDQVTDQVTAEVFRLLTVLRGRMSRLEIQSALGLKHLPHLRDAYLNPAIKEGLLEMTIPEKPQSRHQKYRLTSAGKTLAERIKAQK